MEAAIRATAKTYIRDEKEADELSCQYEACVRKTTGHYRQTRNAFAHGEIRVYAHALTEEGLWESGVAGGMTPILLNGEFWYPSQVDRLRAGKYAMLLTVESQEVV